MTDDTMYTHRPAFTSGICVYDDPARAIWVHEGEVWLSDPEIPSGCPLAELVETDDLVWIRDFVYDIALEMARLGKTVSAWPTEEVQP